MNVQAEQNADHDRENDFEEMKEDIDMFGNPSVRRKARRRQESIVIKRNI